MFLSEHVGFPPVSNILPVLNTLSLCHILCTVSAIDRFVKHYTPSNDVQEMSVFFSNFGIHADNHEIFCVFFVSHSFEKPEQ